MSEDKIDNRESGNDLLTAINADSYEFAERILANGVYIDELALPLAVVKNRYNIVKLLLDNGATDVNKALGYAVSHHNIGIINLLLEYNANITDDLLACSNIDIVQFLLNKGAKPTKESRALVIAAQNNNIEVVKLLLENGAEDIDRALAQAISYERTGIINILKSYNST